MVAVLLRCPACLSRFRVPDGAVAGDGREVRCGSCGHQWHATPDQLIRSTSSPTQVPLDTSVASTPPEALAEHITDKEVAEQSLDEHAQDVLSTIDAATLSTAEDEVEDKDAPDRADRAEPSDSTQHKNSVELPEDIPLETLLSMPLSTEKELQEAARKGSKTTRLLWYGTIAACVLCCITALLLFRQSIISAIPQLTPLYSSIGYDDTSHIQLADLRFSYHRSGDAWRYNVEGSLVSHHIDGLPLDTPPPMIRARLYATDGTLLETWQRQLEDVDLLAGGSTEFRVKNLRTMAQDGASLTLELGSPVELWLRD
ncbi:MAG: hypothetical protein F6K62_10190 [Sphaerospermopsis sp. SIO1G2]|nr:hypothetical protein [Sphaerospermopsis sp. SIO1G2]